MKLLRSVSRILHAAHFEYRLLAWEIICKFRRSITFSTKQGVFTVLCEVNDPIGRSLYCRREYELSLMSSSMRFLRSIGKCPLPGEGTIIDVGANSGVVSIGMIHSGEVERAIAFEPEPQNYSLLLHNVKQNDIEDRVLCLPYAVSDKNGEVQLELSESNLGDHRVRSNYPVLNPNKLFQESKRRVIKVKSEKLDSLLPNLPTAFTQNIAVIWVDVQGHEGHVFMGAKNILSMGVPVVAEIEPYSIRRSGMDREQFCSIARSIWSSYWIMRRGKFIEYPIDILDTLFDELGYDGGHTNVILTQ